MSSKRKFTIAPLSDDEGETSTSTNLGGVNAFKKYKQQAEKEKSSAPIEKKSTGAENSINSKQVQKTNEEKPSEKNDEKSRGPQQGGNSSSETGNSVPVATNPVGKNFRETFAYLKKTDLFVLPPMPDPKPKPAPKNTNSIIVNSKQRGNPILKHIRNIPWEYGDIVPDYEIGQTSCALFLSMRYHSLNPDYIHERLKKLGTMYDLRVLLVQVDVVNCKPSLKELGRMAIYSNCTLILAWSAEEAGRYLETFKSYEHKPPDILQQRVDSDHLSKMQDLLTTIKSINKTDVITLLSTFGSLRNIVNATKQEITDCPGLGSQKANRLYNAFNEPFKRATSLSSQFVPQDVTASTRTTNKDKKSTSFTELPPDCQLKRPTSSQTSTDSETKKARKSEKSVSNLKDDNKEQTDTINKDGKDKQFNTNLEHKSNGSTATPPVASNEQKIDKESRSIDGISKSEAIHQFMKGKTKPIDNKNKNSSTTSNISQTIIKEKSKSVSTVTSVTARLRNELKQRTLDVKKTEISTLTNTSLSTVSNRSNVASGVGSSKGLGSTHITDDEFKDLVASSGDEDDDSDD